MKTSLPSVPDFSDQVLFIGIDLHKRHWRIALRMRQIELKGASIDPDPARLRAYVEQRYPGARYVSCYEAGCFGFSIHERLLELGIENRIVHPADVPATDKDRRYKTDRRDARKLARELEKGSLQGIFIPGPAQRHLRSLWRLRFRLVGEQTRYKNRIKSFLTFSGYPFPDVGSHWSRPFLEHLLTRTPEAGQLMVRHLVEALYHVRAQVAALTRDLSARVSVPVLELFMSVPGIGRITALALYCELMEPNRFKDIDHLCSYVGLIPSTHSSGAHQDPGRLTRRRNRYLRALLIEAAWVAIRQDPALTAAFVKLKQRMKSQEAIIRIAKKLLRRLWKVWRSGEAYRYGIAC